MSTASAMEKLIKLHKAHLATDRMSCHSATANQVRLALHTSAFWLMHRVRSATCSARVVIWPACRQCRVDRQCLLSGKDRLSAGRLSWYNRASSGKPMKAGCDLHPRAYRNRENKNMKAWSIVGLVFAATIFATIPLSPQVTSRGLALNVDQAQAITYGHARRVSRRVDRRDYRQTRRAVRRGVY